MGFKAADYVEPLDYDFRPHFDYYGTITEPSDRDISRFLKKWYHLVGEMRKVVAAAVVEAAHEARDEQQETSEATEPVVSADEAAEAMANIDWTAIEDESDNSPGTLAARYTLTQMCRLVEDLAHGSIRADKLEQVPMRIRGVFFGWLVGELTEQGKGKIGSLLG